MVDIFMDEIKVDKPSIELVDHEIIKLNYNQQYCKSVEIKAVSGGLVSNVFKKEFKPNPIKINTVPSDIGGVVIIEGQRLSSSIKSTPLVKIGNYSCIVISSTINTIECNIKPIPKGSILKDLIVSISIDGIKNDNKLLFSFDTPFISDILITQVIIKVNGNCLGANSSTQIYLYIYF
ncbi:hypothetical protein ACTFIZ_001809 [Dictyostelium cf. discoideum]